MYKWFREKSTAEDVVNKFGGPGILNEKIAVVTGGNSGIGTESVKQFVYAGAHVIVGSRSVEKGIDALKEAGIDVTKCTVVELELEDLESCSNLLLMSMHSHELIFFC